MRAALIIAQAASFAGLGTLFIIEGEWRLGVAQLLLAGVQGLIYA